MLATDEEVRSWFEQAASLPPESRQAFVESNCPDKAVRAEVLSLLQYDVDEDPDGTSDSPVPLAIRCALGSVLGDGNAVRPAHRVGSFEIGRLLGSGGMGFVYEGHRVDGAVKQRVAVKFVQIPPAASQSVRDAAHRRFHRERQMLASLRHPYIAGLIDAGTTIDGMPYAVIEQVDGEPVDSYCDRCLPDREDRIRLFLKLCDAVRFAHGNLIVHSDIKPDNILVTPDGIPKLIDFGVASDIGDDATLTTLRAFTPGYASPEQSRGVASTVATDVYGLGAVLYRLLTGAKPRDVAGSLGQVIQHISEDDVVRPSAIELELKGDLENILLKALQREPQRRYGSVPEFADDLNRYLARRPVRATPDSAWYRSSRFVRRHWATLGFTASLVAVLAIAALVAIVQRQNALHHAAETRRLAERLLFEVHDEIGGVLGGTKAREKLGAIAVQYLESLGRDHGRDSELAWELLNAYSRLGQSRGGGASSTGDTQSALHSAIKALELGGIVESASPDDGRADKLFAIYEGLATVFHEAGRPVQQREAIDRMLRLASRLKPLREAQALKVLARYLEQNGSEGEAAGAFARALPIVRTLANKPSAPAETQAQLTSTLVGFGRAQALAGNFSGAVESLQEAIRRSESSAASDPHMAKSARQLYWSHIALGDVFGSPQRFSLNRPLDAARHYQKARAIAEKLVQADAGNEMAKLDLARTYSREAMVLAARQPAQAIALLQRFHDIVLQNTSRNPSTLDSRLTYLASIVMPLVASGEFERARLHMSEARRLYAEMREAGIKVNETLLLRSDAIRLHAMGQGREALAEAQKHLALLPKKTNPVLSANFESVDLLERMRTYAAGVDQDACASASERLARIWDDLKAIYPQSRFVLEQAARAGALGKGCELKSSMQSAD